MNIRSKQTLPTQQQEVRSRVLIVDDEQAIADLIASLLQQEHMDTEVFTDPLEALQSFSNCSYDLAILDVMMPVMDGYELCKNIRQYSDIPIIFLSARDEETDKVIGLTLGADDYVSKPFKPRELIARVRAHLRRAKGLGIAAIESQTYEMDGLLVNVTEHKVTLYDEPLTLTPKEFSILKILIQNLGRPISAKDLYEKSWNEPYDSSAANTVMVHIRHLRKKLAQIDSSKEYINTIWGVGYCMPASKVQSKESSTHE